MGKSILAFRMDGGLSIERSAAPRGRKVAISHKAGCLTLLSRVDKGDMIVNGRNKLGIARHSPDH